MTEIAEASGFAAFGAVASVRRWCAWRPERDKSGRMVKRPYVGLERPARVDKQKGWLPFEGARDLAFVFADQGAQSGVGILLGPLPDGRRLIALDLDACRRTETGAIAPWAEAILEKFAGAYTEVSPSGGGLHVLFLLKPGAEADALLAGLGRKNRRSWKRDAAKGEKAAAIEVLPGGYVTVTAAPLPRSPARLGELDVVPLAWLLEEGVPAFLGQERSQDAPQAGQRLEGDHASAVAPPGPPQPAAARQRAPSVQMFRAAPDRLQRQAEERTCAEFQLLAALWAWGRKGRPGCLRSSVPSVRLQELPGEPGKRRPSRDDSRADGALAADKCGRSPKTIARARRGLLDAGVMVEAAAPVPPLGRRRGGPGRAAEYEVTAPFIAPAGLPDGHHPEVRRMPRETWRHAVWSLPPAALRIMAWIWATETADEFDLSAHDQAKTLGLDREYAASGLAALVAGGWLDEIRPSVPRRAGRYALGRLLKKEVE